MKDFRSLAIEAALRQDWETAIRINLELLKKYPEDLEALKRLAFAQMEAGDLEKAKKNYKKILKLDSFNPIALKNLNKLSSIKPRRLKKKNQNQTLGGALASDLGSLFLEEIGKTKVVKLKNLPEAHILSQQNPGEEVNLSIKRRGISILDRNGNYLGALPDDLAHRLIQFMKYGNKYQAFIKSADKNFLSIFIKEIERSSKFKNQPSFTNTPLTYLSSVREEVFEGEQKPQVTALEDLEEEEDEEDEEEKEA